MDLPNPLRQLRDLDKTSPQFHKQFSNFLRGDEYRNTFPNLQSEDLAWLVEYLDSGLIGISDPASVAFQECLHELRKLCGAKEVLPRSYMLSDSLLDISLPSASGCAYEGTLGGSKVRIQRVRLYPESDPQKVKETFRQSAVTWKHLAHPNVVPLLGVTIDSLQLISEWMSGGDLTEYITNHPVADRLSLLSDVAGGLNYLHSCNVIHGDLKGTNVLVDATGCARIADFGLAVIAQNPYSTRSGSVGHGDSARWIAPEILGNRGSYSKESDVFSFAMVMIEAFTGAVPFSDKPPRMAMSAIVGGERPPRPTHPTLTDRLWALVQQCWDQAAQLRPEALEILRGLGIPAWKCLVICPRVIDERISLITAIFSDRNESGAVRRLSGDDAQTFVDVVDKALDNLPPQLRKKCLSALCKICGRQGLLPRSLQIPLCYDRLDNALYNGGYADVWMGEHQGRKVAVKVLRVYSTSNLAKIIRRFCKEVLTWKNLRHTNVLPLLGVTMSKSQFAMVSEWMVNGNINEFIKAHRDTNRFELLENVARGLIYMHGEGMIHGDLKGANILIDQNGHACLADFGLLTIVSESTYPTTESSSSGNAGTTRWMSPELLDPDRFGSDGRPTKESDCYALGMVILEVLSGETPFPCDNGLVVMRKVIEGRCPERPQGAGGAWFTDDLWEALERCWSPQPKNRPTVRAMLERLERGSAVWQPLLPSSDDEVQTDSDDESNSTVSCYQSTSQPPVESQRSASPVPHPVRTVSTPVAPPPSQAIHLPIVHSVDVGLGFQQDQSSPKTIDPVDEDGALSSPEIVPSEDEGDIPSSPGYLPPIGEESSVEPSIQDLRDTDPSGTIKPVPRTCECKICVRPPAESRFRDLIKVLNDLRLVEDPEPRFSTVGPRLLRQNPSIYDGAGVAKFKEYVETAVKAGVVTARGVKNGDGWLKLCPDYRDPPVHSLTPASTISIPPTRAASTTSPFAPLVEFLKSKQLTSAQPVPFSDILAHLISTIGYPDLLSLYNGIPGVTTFSHYLGAAITSGVVSLVSGTATSRDPLVSLRDTGVTLALGPQLPRPIGPTASQRGAFGPLISTLTKLWREGKQEPMLSEIRPLILAQGILAYGQVGAVTIKDYVMKAAAANLVIYDPLVMPGVSFMASTVRLRDPPLQSTDGPPPPVQPSVSATPLPTHSPLQEIAVPLPPVNVTPSSFRDLVAVLTKLQASTWESESRFSSIVPLLLKRRPDAYASVGVGKFKDYVILAMENGVVRIRGMKQGDGWVSLSDPRPGGLKSSSSVPPQSSGSSEDGTVTARSSPISLKGAGVDPKFVDLVETLGEMWKNGDKKPPFSLVAPQLLRDERKKTRTLNVCGVDKFKAYAELAKEAGIVEIHYKRLGERRISLAPLIRVRAGLI